jgi:hypothetical protein
VLSPSADSALQCREGGYSAAELAAGGVDAAKLKDVFSLPELKDAGFSPKELHACDRKLFSLENLMAAGFEWCPSLVLTTRPTMRGFGAHCPHRYPRSRCRPVLARALVRHGSKGITRARLHREQTPGHVSQCQSQTRRPRCARVPRALLRCPR